MEKSNLICHWNEQNGKVVYLVPSMLTAKPDKDISGLIGQGKLAPIYIKFSSGYVPYGVFCRFLVLFGQQSSPECPATPPKLFANAARFVVGQQSNYNLTLACFKSVITVHLVFEGKSEDGRETASICRHICRLVMCKNKFNSESCTSHEQKVHHRMRISPVRAQRLNPQLEDRTVWSTLRNF